MKHKSLEVPRQLPNRPLAWVGVTLWLLLGGIAASRLAVGGQSQEMLWAVLGVTAAWLYAHWMLQHILPGWQLARQLGRERLETNLHRLGFKGPLWGLWFWWKSVLAVVLPFAVLITSFGGDLWAGGARVLAMAQSERMELHIEFASWANRPSEDHELNFTPQSFAVDTNGLLEIRGTQLDPAKPTRLTLTSPGHPGRIDAQLSAVGRWGSSVKGIWQTLGLNLSESAELQFEIQSPKGKYLASVQVSAIPMVDVHLGFSKKGAPDENSSPSLVFLEIAAASQVPITLVELQARTTSGYRFRRSVAEFANTSSLDFRSDEVQLLLTGIPFAPKDSLFIKALVKTSVAEVHGESKEIELRIRNPQDLKMELQKALEQALQHIQSGDRSETARFSLQKKLEEAQNLARQALGRQTPVRRKIAEAQFHSQQMTHPDDRHAQEAKKSLKAAIEMLQRKNSLEQAASLFARLQNLRQNLPHATAEEQKQMAKEMEKLSNEAKDLKKNLNQMAQQESNGLSIEEKQLISRMLKLDKTPELIQDSADQLKGNKPMESAQTLDKAIEESGRNILSSLQMLQRARQRAVREARQKLQEADDELQNAREQNGDTRGDALKNAQQTLRGLPRLGGEVDDATRDAQDATDRAVSQHKQGRHPMGDIGQGQDAISRALAALDEMESNDRQNQSEQDSISQRSSMDALQIQGQIDASWRRNILEEIARLRSAGESPDSPLIRYLESRLR